MKLSPSVLACNFSHLGEDIKKVEEAGVQYLHLDVMDGIFVPNISFGPCVIKSIRPLSKLVFDTHLMITEPIRYIDDFKKAGADIITIHYESCSNQIETLEYIRSLGIRSSISIKPATPAFVLEPILKYVDMVLIMSVEPGFGGQSFISETLESVRAIAAMRKKFGYDFEIEIDGGITLNNVKNVIEAGVDVVVAGSSIFGSDNIKKAVDSFFNI